MTNENTSDSKRKQKFILAVINSWHNKNNAF